MTRDFYDLIIVGAGPAGLTLAAQLGPTGRRILLLEQATTLNRPGDLRTTALAAAAKEMYETMGLWAELGAGASPITTIRVVDDNSTAFADFIAAELGVEAFGYIIDNHHHRAVLAKAMNTYPSVEFQTNTSVTGFTQAGDLATLTTADGRVYQTPLVVAADGKFSKLRELAGIPVRKHDYASTAVVTVIAHEHPHEQLALEHFLPQGPLALLPMSGQRSSVVWSMPHAAAKAMCKAGADAFVAAMQPYLGTYWGACRPLTGLAAYPLQRLHAQTYTAPNFVLVGEAAHAMHPIAGQGFNMTVRDLITLTGLLKAQSEIGLPFGTPELLSRFNAQRRFDTQTMLSFTDGMDKLFTTSNPVLTGLRRLGLQGVEHLPLLKRGFAKAAMGKVGPSPLFFNQILIKSIY